MKKIILITQLITVMLFGNNLSYSDYIDETKYTLIEKDIDINDDKKTDLIWLCLAKDRESPNLLYVFLKENNGKYHTLLKKDLENFKNRPYNGYSLKSEKHNLILDLSYPQSRGGNIETYSFIISYENQNLVMKNVFYKKLNLCDFSLMETYKIDLNLLENTVVETFKPLDVFEKMEENKLNSKYFYKVFTINMKNEYKKMLKLFKKGEIKKLQTYIRNNIIIESNDLDDSRCNPVSYIGKYFFVDKVSYTNDMAFFLEQAGYYRESAFLLEKVLEKHSKRTVAYYNLGDAYWGLDKNVKAKKAYQTYIKLMIENGKEKKIPKKVLERAK